MPAILRNTIAMSLICLAIIGCSTPKAKIVSVAEDSPLAQIRAESMKVRHIVQSKAAHRFLDTADYLPPIESRTLYRDPDTGEYFNVDSVEMLSDERRERLTEKEYDEAYYYMGRYGTPVAYCRAIDLAAQAGMNEYKGKRVLDFGYGMIGQLRMLALLGAEVIGVEISAILPALYGFPEDQGTVPSIEGRPGSIQLMQGRFPAESEVSRAVGDGYDLIMSKNVLKRGYIHPAREVDERMTIKLGVDDDAFVKAIYDALNPGGVFIIYNLSPKQNPPDEPYIPWADGQCPFDRSILESTGFEILAMDEDDSAWAREMASILGWDTRHKMSLQDDLFALYTICRK